MIGYVFVKNNFPKGAVAWAFKDSTCTSLTRISFYILKCIHYSGIDKEGIWRYLRDNFAYFSIKTYVVGTH